MEKKTQATELTNTEKAALLQGTDFMYTREIKRLGIPRISMADGPHGLRKQAGSADNGIAQSEPATAFPTAACMASSWNPENAQKIGQAIGEECRCYGVHILLGPGVNIKRNPLCGRNFEYYSEDPLLAGKFGAAFIRGVQKENVCACVKHFALNNQENFRFVGNSVADERTMREIYLKPFEIAVREGNPGAVMSSYNRINGVFACENRWLLKDVLREEWGFNGIVMSDWGGTHDRIAGIRAGEDLEMPGDTAVNRKKVYDALKDGSLSQEEADVCISRILDTAKRFVGEQGNAPVLQDWSATHTKLAADVAADSAVLMKNDGLLPLKREKPVCVIGELFVQMRYQGSGSSMISPTQVITHKDAFDARKVKYEYAPGYSVSADLPKKKKSDLLIEAAALAERYDTILLYLGLTDLAESEGGDRTHMRLPEDQLRLALALAGMRKKIAVVLSGGSPVELPFADSVSAILNLYLPGQCGGEAGARLLFGEVSPSGRLAETWYRTYDDVPYGKTYSRKVNELYRENIFVGYRYTNTAGVRPAFPFGFGLSYTKFTYRNLRMVQDAKEEGTVNVLVDLCNSGPRDGAEVVQLYVKNNKNCAVCKPERELRAFTKVYLTAGEEKTVSLTFVLSELAFWDVSEGRWNLENGEYTVEIAASAEDILLTAPLEVTVKETVTSETNGNMAAVWEHRVLQEKTNRTGNDTRMPDDQTFASLLGTPIPQEPEALPLTLESRFCDFRKTFMGRILYNAVCSVAKNQMKKARKLPPGTERDNRVKGAIFLQRIFDTNCMRTMSLSAGKSFPWNLAEGFVYLGNGQLIRGISAMCRSYRIKETDEKSSKQEKRK